MSVQIENLLRPRYKVIIKAPGCFKVGTIIEKHKYASGNWYIPNYMYDPEDFPDVFKKLEWWDERAIDEMPEYVKAGIEVYKIDHWFATNGTASVVDEINGGTRNTTFMMKAIKPATLAEYEQYINKKEKQ